MKHHILLVDDDVDELTVFMEALSNIPIEGDFKCTYAGTAEQALEMLKYLVPDFIFVDLHMGGMDGLQLLSAINEQTNLRHSRMYLYSTNINEAACRKAKTSGATGCIEKTNSVGELGNQLKPIFHHSYIISGGHNS